MSVREASQALTEPIEKLLVAIREFETAATNRILDVRGWQRDHREELAGLVGELQTLRFKLAELKENVW